jgi:hypothetical protein
MGPLTILWDVLGWLARAICGADLLILAPGSGPVALRTARFRGRGFNSPE